jgi:hypothetical protein
MEAVEDVTVESRSLVSQATNIFVRVQADALPRMASLVRDTKQDAHRPGAAVHSRSVAQVRR